MFFGHSSMYVYFDVVLLATIAGSQCVNLFACCQPKITHCVSNIASRRGRGETSTESLGGELHNTSRLVTWGVCMYWGGRGCICLGVCVKGGCLCVFSGGWICTHSQSEKSRMNDWWPWLLVLNADIRLTMCVPSQGCYAGALMKQHTVWGCCWILTRNWRHVSQLNGIFAGAQMKTTHNLRLLCTQVLDLCRHKPHTVGYAASFRPFLLFMGLTVSQAFSPLSLYTSVPLAFCTLQCFIVHLREEQMCPCKHGGLNRTYWAQNFQKISLADLLQLPVTPVTPRYLLTESRATLPNAEQPVWTWDPRGTTCKLDP